MSRCSPTRAGVLNLGSGSYRGAKEEQYLTKYNFVGFIKLSFKVFIIYLFKKLS